MQDTQLGHLQNFIYFNLKPQQNITIVNLQRQSAATPNTQ